MKLVFASIVALGVVTAPAIAQTTPSTKSTKTMMTTHHKSTTTTEEKGETAAQEAKERHHGQHHHKTSHHKTSHHNRHGATSTKTIVTKGPKSTAVTTVTTKVKPNTPPKK